MWLSPCARGAEFSQDAILVYEVSPSCAVLAVCDGVGGQQYGDLASRGTLTAIAAMLDRLKAAASGGQEPSPTVLRATILDAIDAANELVMRIGAGAATTLALVDVLAGRCRSYHVGDSGVLHFDRRGDIKRRTFGHGPVGARLVAGLVSEEEARELPDANIVHNVIGDPGLRTEVGTDVALIEGDSLLVASDGLLDHMTTAEIVAALRVSDAVDGVAKSAAVADERMRHSDWGHLDDLSICLARPLRSR